MFAGIGNFIDDSRKRLVLSFTVTAICYFVAFYYMQNMTVFSKEKTKRITNVELMQIQPNKPAEAQALTPAEAVRRLLQAPAPLKPVSKIQQLTQIEKSQLEDLKRERDQKLNDLMNMTGGAEHKVAKLISQEAVLTERAKPIIRPAIQATMGAEGTISMEEVGIKKAGNITDVMNKETTPKTSGLLIPSQLVEKRVELKKQLAALGSGTMETSSRLEDRSGSAGARAGDLREIVGSMQERKTAQEVIALEKIIQEKEPPKQGVTGGGFGFSQQPAKGLGGEQAIKLNEPNAIQPISIRQNVPDVNAIMRTRVRETFAEVKKAPVEIRGPIEKRKVLQSYVPKYPDWAKKQGIEADVSLRFFVNPQGSVLPDISLVITSGYGEIDQLCVDTLKKWVFAPLGPDEPQITQWGVITIRFRLE